MNQLQAVLEHHTKEGLPAADLQVIRRGKALEYFSRHYGKVYLNESRTIEVREAVVGIIQLLDEASSGEKDVPATSTPNRSPGSFCGFSTGDANLRATRCRSSCAGRARRLRSSRTEAGVWSDKRVFHLVEPSEHARAWAGNSRRSRDRDYDQALFSIGACFDGSGINASRRTEGGRFPPQPALGFAPRMARSAGRDASVSVTRRRERSRS